MSEKTEVIYVTGNHDEIFRSFPNIKIGKIAVEHRCVHVGIDGKRYLVVHGDLFDNLMRTKTGRFIMHLGDFAYDSLLYINKIINEMQHSFAALLNNSKVLIMLFASKIKKIIEHVNSNKLLIRLVLVKQPYNKIKVIYLHYNNNLVV